MSHAFLLVLVPGDTKPEDVHAAVEGLIAPYDEGIEVDEYEEKCWCVGRAAENAARISAVEKCGTIESIRAGFHARPDVKEMVEKERIFLLGKGPPSKEDQKTFDALDKKRGSLWKAAIEPWQEAEKDALVVHPDKDSPASDCDSCGGTGKAKSTYNPKSKWDWWVIGGRYDGLVKGERRDDGDGGFNFGEAHHQPRFNVAPASEVIAKIGTDDEVGFFALVTPDGEWHERGRLGWWGNVHGEKNDWDAGKNQILRAHPDCLVVGVDYHI